MRRLRSHKSSVRQYGTHGIVELRPNGGAGSALARRRWCSRLDQKSRLGLPLVVFTALDDQAPVRQNRACVPEEGIPVRETGHRASLVHSGRLILSASDGAAAKP